MKTTVRVHGAAESNDLMFVKWSLMFAGLFWMVVYHLADQAARLPEFVYVHF